MSRALCTPTLTLTRTSLPVPLKFRLKLSATICIRSRSTVSSYFNPSITTSTGTFRAPGFASRYLPASTTPRYTRYTPHILPSLSHRHQTASMSSTNPSITTSSVANGAATTTPTSTPTAKIHTLDHLVLTVRSLSETIAFYTTHLGMQHQKFSPAHGGEDRHALLFGPHKINLHQHGREFEPKAQTVQPGSADLCFLTEDDIEMVRERFVKAGVEGLGGGGGVRRTGARGGLRSVYIRDPDGNLVEISNEVKE